MNVTLFGKRGFVDVNIIKLMTLRGDHPGLPSCALNPITLQETEEEKTQTGEGQGQVKSEMRVMQPEPRKAWSHQKLPEARKDSLLEPVEGVQPC